MKSDGFAGSMIGRKGQRQLSHVQQVQQVFLIPSWQGGRAHLCPLYLFASRLHQVLVHLSFTVEDTRSL